MDKQILRYAEAVACAAGVSHRTVLWRTEWSNARLRGVAFALMLEGGERARVIGFVAGYTREGVYACVRNARRRIAQGDQRLGCIMEGARAMLALPRQTEDPENE